MRKLWLLILSAISFNVSAQTYNDSLLAFRQHYKEEFLTEERSPLKAKDTTYLRFYAPDASYRVVARLQLAPDSKPFDIPTHSGKKKSYRQYGILHFKIGSEACSLQVFQSQMLMKDPKYKDDLFVPFTDETTYTETYGGGRYMDLLIPDIKNGKIVLDFNKCYNPYCAYGEGYNCPIPPRENRLPVAIRAGEKLFGREVDHQK